MLFWIYFGWICKLESNWQFWDDSQYLVSNQITNDHFCTIETMAKLNTYVHYFGYFVDWFTVVPPGCPSLTFWPVQLFQGPTQRPCLPSSIWIILAGNSLSSTILKHLVGTDIWHLGQHTAKSKSSLYVCPMSHLNCYWLRVK